MQLKNMVPSVPEVGREAIIVLGSALIAAFIVGQFPAVRNWIKNQWADAQH